MKGLRGLLIRKIIITFIFLCIPLLSFPSTVFVALGVPAPQPLVIVRLLGVAYPALIVGYYGGIQGLRKGRRPLSVIDMGLVSNGLASLVLFFFGITNHWSAWSKGAQIYMWLLAVGALVMTLQLLRARRKYAGS